MLWHIIHAVTYTRNKLRFKKKEREKNKRNGKKCRK